MLKRFVLSFAAVMNLLLIDQVVKELAVRQLKGSHAVEVVPNLFNLGYVENRGMAFSMLSGQTLALTLVTAALIAALAGWLIARPESPRLLRAGLWLIVGGGLGNLYDRLTRGGVADFIELAFVRFAVFNVADICICVGAALAALGVLMTERRRTD